MQNNLQAGALDPWEILNPWPEGHATNAKQSVGGRFSPVRDFKSMA
ncbi:hypothetical protein [Alteromonas sp. M12]